MEVLRHTKRQEHLHFILILPDGTKSLVPADWTDFAASSTLQTPDGTLVGSLEDLLQLRRHPFDSRRVMAQLNLKFMTSRFRRQACGRNWTASKSNSSSRCWRV